MNKNSNIDLPSDAGAGVPPFTELDPAKSVTAAGDRVAQLPVWTPPVDIGEDALEYLLVIEMPGIPVGDIRVEARGNTLDIAADAALAAAEQGKHYLRIEREFGRCHRAFTLPADAKGDELYYESCNGVLRIHIPRATPAAVIPGRSPREADRDSQPVPEARKTTNAIADDCHSKGSKQSA